MTLTGDLPYQQDIYLLSEVAHMDVQRRYSLSDGEGSEEDDLGLADGASLNASSASRLLSRQDSQDDYIKSKKPTVFYLLLFFLINSLAFGLIAVPRMNLVVSLVCVHTKGHNTTPPIIVGGFNPSCQDDSVSAETALIAARGNIIVGVLAAIVSTTFGRLSDRIGRLKVIAFNTLGLIATEGTLLTIAMNPESLNYRWLYLAYAVDGASGSYALTMAMASAYVSDCCPADERSVQIGRLHGAMFIGIAVGPLLSTLVSKIGGQKLPLLVFYVSLAMRAFSILYLQFVPESRVTKTATMLRVARTKDLVGMVGRSCRPKLTLMKLDPRVWLEHLIPHSVVDAGRLRKSLVVLMAVDLIIYAGVMGTMEVLILYPQVVYGWGNLENNIFMSVVNACRAAVSMLGLPLLVYLFRKSRRIAKSSAKSDDSQTGADSLDKALIRTSILIDIAGYLGFALSPNGILFTICGALAAFAATGLASTEAALTKHVDGERTGELMGGLSLVQGVVRIAAPSFINLVYSWTVKQGVPYAAFLGIGAFLCLGAVLTIFVRTK
ncbi:MAG: Hippocampus abundant transcript 1 protein [Bogoriella megaspora]|nr:MAG: Hippocampus abundant transcript 1 protein [Bogoriella megaspora]